MREIWVRRFCIFPELIPNWVHTIFRVTYLFSMELHEGLVMICLKHEIFSIRIEIDVSQYSHRKCVLKG